MLYLQLESKHRQRDLIAARLSGTQPPAVEGVPGLTHEQSSDPAQLQDLLPQLEAEMTQ